MGFMEDRIALFSTMFDGSRLRCSDSERQSGGANILFLSRFVPEKGIYELLEGFSEIVREFPDARLVMAGGGPEEANAAQWVREHRLTDSVVFPGYIKGEEKADALLKSNLFILPTYYGEGCPNAILEAMGAGLPVITTHAGGIPDVVADGVNGILLEAVTSNAVADAMRRLLVNTELCDRMSRENKITAWERYESAVVTKRLEKIYKELIT
jgi:glycosyltransferase involved in cell wall biosynthesis